MLRSRVMSGRKVEAQQRKAEKAYTEKTKAQKAEEDAYWHDEGDKNMQKKAER